ncbi:MAG: GLPGLI family protein [Saprospiraceae bacterium]|nr:GLPGLI family protein [Saprospiraceae bacterium]
MKIYFSLICLMFISIGNSQPMTSGKITYKETIKLNIDIGDNNPEMAKMIPSSQSAEKVLYFTANESLYKNEEKPKDVEVKHEEDGNDFQLVIKMPETIIYSNKKEDQYLQSQDLMGKEFLISDKIDKLQWKVTPEQKKILNYVCQKAVLSDTSKNLAVWFTNQLPVSIGPNGLSGLPGLILAIEQDNGDRMTIATAVDALPEAFVFTKPSKGKVVKRVEYEQIREDKMKEMGAINGKGSGIKMIIREERN